MNLAILEMSKHSKYLELFDELEEPDEPDETEETENFQEFNPSSKAVQTWKLERFENYIYSFGVKKRGRV